MNIKAKSKSRSGYTLTELLFSLFIFSLVTIGLVAFIYSSINGLYWASNKSLITKDVRSFTMRLGQESLRARAAYAYESFSLADRTVGGRRNSGGTGDCLVLISYEPTPNIDSPEKYTNLTVFYRRPDSHGESPVYRAEVNIDPPVEVSTVPSFEVFLNSQFPDELADHPVVLELSKGLADGKLFKNFDNKTYVVNGEILHGNEVKEVSNTYNLTISPRG